MNNELPFPQLSLQEFKNSVMNRLLDIFNYPCPLISPFTSKMNSRLVIYNEMQPIDTNFLMSIISISKSMGEEGFYFSFVEVYDYKIWYPGMPNEEKYLKSWFIPFDKVKDYQEQIFLTNHVVYSQLGNWGVFVNVDHFLIMGGISGFMSQIYARHPNLNEKTDEFIQAWKDWNLNLNYKLEWIPDLLEHIYGMERAKLLIQKHKLK